MFLTFVFCEFINSRFICFNQNTACVSMLKIIVSSSRETNYMFGLMAAVFQHLIRKQTPPFIWLTSEEQKSVFYAKWCCTVKNPKQSKYTIHKCVFEHLYLPATQRSASLQLDSLKAALIIATANCNRSIGRLRILSHKAEVQGNYPSNISTSKSHSGIGQEISPLCINLKPE